MSATIREAEAGEEERILPMYEWLFATPGYRPRWWDEARARLALTEAIVSPQSSVFVAEDGDALVGFCTAYLELNSVRFGQRCWVEDLATHPDHRSGASAERCWTPPRTGPGGPAPPTSSWTPAWTGRTPSASTIGASLPPRATATPGCFEQRWRRMR